MKNQLVEFDAIACCAMREAFLVNQEEFVHLKNHIGEENFNVLTQIFKRTVRMSVFMKPVHVRFYLVAIVAELKRLGILTPTISLPCGHTAYDHMRAIESLKNQITQPQKVN
ncbi:MAG: hypothetical protein AAB824_02565 [Patescibacteria group bacterium]